METKNNPLMLILAGTSLLTLCLSLANFYELRHLQLRFDYNKLIDVDKGLAHDVVPPVDTAKPNQEHRSLKFKPEVSFAPEVATGSDQRLQSDLNEGQVQDDKFILDTSNEGLFFLPDLLVNPFSQAMPESEVLEAIWNQVSTAKSVKIKEGDIPIYVLFSASCIECKRLYEDVISGIGSKTDLQVNFLPLNFDSIGSFSSRAALATQASLRKNANPEKLLSDIFGGMAFDLDQVIVQDALDVDKNTLLGVQLSKLTPTIIFRDKNGTVKIIATRPSKFSDYLQLSGQ